MDERFEVVRTNHSTMDKLVVVRDNAHPNLMDMTICFNTRDDSFCYVSLLYKDFRANRSAYSPSKVPKKYKDLYEFGVSKIRELYGLKEGA